MFGTALDRVPSLAGNVKFTALLWATVDQRKEAVGCSIVQVRYALTLCFRLHRMIASQQSASPAIHELAMRITTFHKKKLLDVANLGSACAT